MAWMSTPKAVNEERTPSRRRSAASNCSKRLAALPLPPGPLLFEAPPEPPSSASPSSPEAAGLPGAAAADAAAEAVAAEAREALKTFKRVSSFWRGGTRRLWAGSLRVKERNLPTFSPDQRRTTSSKPPAISLQRCSQSKATYSARLSLPSSGTVCRGGSVASTASERHASKSSPRDSKHKSKSGLQMHSTHSMLHWRSATSPNDAPNHRPMSCSKRPSCTACQRRPAPREVRIPSFQRSVERRTSAPAASKDACACEAFAKQLKKQSKRPR
mmetsp:Transcript_16844/g.46657  ORF Transcript_16844/g.46657 Transcript_16844/m.46657 type:complete len:272 (-) Transcript_16844:90-905(-)